MGMVTTDAGMLSRCMAASTTSLLVAVGSETGHLRLVDCRQQSLSVLQRLRVASERLSSVAFSPDGAFVAVSCLDRQALELERPSTTFHSDDSTVRAFADWRPVLHVREPGLGKAQPCRFMSAEKHA